MVFIVKLRSKTSDCLTRINLDLSTPPFYSLKRRKKAGFRTQSHITDNKRGVEVQGEKVVGRAYARREDWHTAEIEMKKWKVGKRRRECGKEKKKRTENPSISANPVSFHGLEKAKILVCCAPLFWPIKGKEATPFWFENKSIRLVLNRSFFLWQKKFYWIKKNLYQIFFTGILHTTINVLYKYSKCTFCTATTYL